MTHFSFLAASAVALTSGIRDQHSVPAELVVVSAAEQEQSAERDQSRSVEKVIEQLDNERIQAQIVADAVALDRIYADDFIGVGPSGTVRTKAQVI